MCCFITTRETIYYSSVPLKEFTYYTDRTISEAVRSTLAIPIAFTPNIVKIDGVTHHMMDGGITNNTSIVPLKQFSDCVIGITSKFYPKIRKRVNLFTGFTQTFQAMRRSSLYYQQEDADLWIEVDVKDSEVFGGVKELEYCEQCGYDAVMEYTKRNLLDGIIK